MWFVEWISLQKSKIKVMASVPMEVCKFSSMWQPIVMSHRKPLDANAVSLLTNFIHFSNICVCECRDDSALHLYNMTVSEELHCFTRPLFHTFHTPHHHNIAFLAMRLTGQITLTLQTKMWNLKRLSNMSI